MIRWNEEFKDEVKSDLMVNRLRWMSFSDQCNTRTVSYDLIQLSYIFQKCQLTVHSFQSYFSKNKDPIDNQMKNKQGNMFNSMRSSNLKRFNGKFRKRKKM
jgi:hypothetical protein